MKADIDIAETTKMTKLALTVGRIACLFVGWWLSWPLQHPWRFSQVKCDGCALQHFDPEVMDKDGSCFSTGAPQWTVEGAGSMDIGFRWVKIATSGAK